MGRRSINTTKSGKYMNPTDQARKEARKKELKKNKKQRQMVRAAVLKGKDPGQLIEEMEKIDEMEYNVFQPSPLNEKVLKEKRKKLKETFDRVMRLYHNDDPELWAELKRKEVEYEKRRNKKVQYYESVRHAQTVQVDEIPLPMSETPQQNTFIVPAGGGRPLQQQPPPPTTTLLTPQNPFVQPPKNINTILTDVISELEQEQQQQQQQPPPLTIMRQKKTKIHRKRDISKKTKKAPQCPPSPPPDITDSREFDLIYDTKELARIRHKKKRDLKHDDKVRNSKDKRRQIQEPEKMIKSSDIKPPEKDTLKPTSLQQRMLALSGQNIDEFMKEMEVVQMKKQQERAADLHTRLSALDKRQQTGPADNLTKNISSSGDHQIGDERSSSHTAINRIKSVHDEEDSNDDDGDNDHDVDVDDDDDALSITSCDESCSEYNMSNDSDSSGNFSGYFSSSSRSSSSSDSSEVSDEEFSRNLGETEHAKLLKLKLKEMSITKSLAFQFPNSITTLLPPTNVRQMSSSIQSGPQQRPPPLPTQPPPPPPIPPQQHHILTKSQLSQIRQSTNVPPPPQPPSQTQTTAPITQFIKLPSGPPPPPVGVPPGLMYRPPPPIRPTNMPMGIRMPPGPPPGPRPGSMHGTGNLPPPPPQQQQQPPRLGIRMPPGPPPGIPPARLMLNNPHGPKSTLNTIIGNTLTAGPLLTKDTKGMTTITAKPQIRNLSADVTRFVPSALRIKREDKKQQIKPRPFIQPIRHYDQPKGTTKDDAYMQFMKEMQGLL